MKQIFTTLLVGICLLHTKAHAQVVLNELYSDPNTGKSEFFELYNTNTSSVPISLDPYSIVTYFEVGTTKGFYVLDLPNISIGARNYFVGASSMPFNYQGTTNSNAANFSWNDPNLAANNGYLKKWVLATGGDITDGNKDYDLAPIPAGFNDLFNKLSGNGATYSIFILKNGKLINGFMGGTGGATSIPSFISSMPPLNITNVSSSPTTVTFSFKNIRDNEVEYVGQDAGSDNGFMRTKDGACGSWTKSSSTVNHTPGKTNGSVAGTASGITISTVLSRGITTNDPSFITYDVTSAPTTAFPIEMQLYKDDGSVQKDIDGNDTYLTSSTEIKVTDGPFTTYFTPQSANIILVAKVAAGCIDQTLFVTNSNLVTSTLPVHIRSFSGSVQNKMNDLYWTVSDNETSNHIEVQRGSGDGKSFTTCGYVFTTDKKGEEKYEFKEANRSTTTYYRLKIINKDGSSFYSSVLTLKNNAEAEQALTLLSNPVQSKLSIRFYAEIEAMHELSVYTTGGNKVQQAQFMAHKGINVIDVRCSSAIKPGIFVAELFDGREKRTTLFVKQ